MDGWPLLLQERLIGLLTCRCAVGMLRIRTLSVFRDGVCRKIMRYYKEDSLGICLADPYFFVEYLTKFTISTRTWYAYYGKS